MRRTRHDIFATSTTMRYIVLWTLHWQAIEAQQLSPRTDLRGAFAATIKRLEADGWKLEGDTAFGFVFINRAGERRLLTLTERDPADDSPQSFNPHRS